jgi:hypothetical protein
MKARVPSRQSDSLIDSVEARLQPHVTGGRRSRDLEIWSGNYRPKLRERQGPTKSPQYRLVDDVPRPDEAAAGR